MHFVQDISLKMKANDSLTGKCWALMTLFNNCGASSCPGNGVTSLGKKPGYDVNYDNKNKKV